MISDINQINYSPNLTFKHNAYTQYTSDQTTESRYNNYYVNVSNSSMCLYNFYNVSTYKLLNKLITIQQCIEDLIVNTKSEQDTQLNIFYNGSNINKEELIKDNSNDIFGSTRLELINELNKINQELELIYKTIATNTYGKENVTPDDAALIDTNEISHMVYLENQGEYENINYLSLYIESSINSIISQFLTTLTEETLPNANILEFEASSQIDVSNYHQIMAKNFNKKAKKMQDSICKDYNTMYNIKVAIDNVYICLQEYENFLEQEKLVRFQYVDAQTYDTIDEEYVNNISQSLDVLYKVLQQSANNKANILLSLSNKNDIRKYFKQNGGVVVNSVG